jgi:hypothetical protein
MQKNIPSYEELNKIAQTMIDDLKSLEGNPKWEKFSDKPCQMFKMEIDGKMASKGVAVAYYPI